MAEPSQTKVRLSVSLSPEQKAVLEQLAVKHQVPLALVVRQAVSEFITKYTDRQLSLFERHESRSD